MLNSYGTKTVLPACGIASASRVSSGPISGRPAEVATRRRSRRRPQTAVIAKRKTPAGTAGAFREDEQGGKFNRMYRSQVRGIIMTKGVCTLLRAARRRAHVIG
jgi:hypothetical protein